MLVEKVKIGKSGEAHVAKLFRDAGYKVRRSPRSRGVFDLFATQGDKVIAVQVKASAKYVAVRRAGLILPMLGVDLGQNARRLYWTHVYTIKRDLILEVTPEGYRPVDLASALA